MYDKVSWLTKANLCLDAIQPSFPAVCRGRSAGFQQDAFGNLLAISGSGTPTIPTLQEAIEDHDRRFGD